ncbi:hypothetical protein OC834_002114 [Tilletia horrida]|nr:hypothetical protein OC835_005085 [Tilletia horrida]KAK0533785.1 hypothetical protein OC834_002114 [Tilletia horrida]
MGNAQSDMGEKEAYDRVIKYVPFVNLGYSTVRAIVYAGKQNEIEAKRSGVGIATGVVETAAWFVPVPGAGPAAKAAATIGIGALTAGATAGLDHAADAVEEACKGAAIGAVKHNMAVQGAKELQKHKDVVRVTVKQLPGTAKQAQLAIVNFCRAHPLALGAIAAGAVVVFVLAAATGGDDKEEDKRRAQTQ